MALRKGILERLSEGVVVGDGSFVWTLEKRGYVAHGIYTPEAAVLYPDAVRQLHRDYLRAGSDVMQTFTFYSTDDKLQFKGATENIKKNDITCMEINNAACDLARQVAILQLLSVFLFNTTQYLYALVAGGLSPVPGYKEGKGKDFVQGEFRKQCNVFKQKDVDFLLGEFFSHVEEAEWAIEIMKELRKPIACTMRMNCTGDWDAVSPADVAVRLAKAGANIVGLNCAHDPKNALKTMRLMKAGLEAAELKPYLMIQPLGFHTQDAGEDKKGWAALPEYPLGHDMSACPDLLAGWIQRPKPILGIAPVKAMEPRTLTRFDVRKFTREAYEMGVRYIGGCCGFEPYHIREIAEELARERGKRPPGVDMSLGVEGLNKNVFSVVSERANMEYWMNLNPNNTGRETILNGIKIDTPITSES